MLLLAASVAGVLALAGAGLEVVHDHSVLPASAAEATPDTVYRPLDNSCSAGYVTFTFDDGPRENTEKLLDTLDGLGINAVFFWTGEKIKARVPTVQRAVADGNVIGNHSWNHPDLTTGKAEDGTRTPWSEEFVRSELERANEEAVKAGAPRPIFYRPPYGAVNKKVDAIAQELGLRLVMSWGYEPSDNLIDSHDSDGASTQEIIDGTLKYIRDGSIITMHDGEGQTTLNSIAALQSIVDGMNEKGLCATTEVREDATGRVLDMYG
jgi:peptidoglycan/xylan/chitin deacetylase (PgdA/CDA1 family)